MADSSDRKQRWKTWCQYNWWRFPLHAALIVLGVINLYPFIWMLGTSLKAEAESSNERLRPVPKMKYRLVDGFSDASLNGIIPTAMEPGFSELVREGAGEKKDAPRRQQYLAARRVLKNKLKLIDGMQRDAWPRNLQQSIERSIKMMSEGDADAGSKVEERAKAFLAMLEEKGLLERSGQGAWLTTKALSPDAKLPLAEKDRGLFDELVSDVLVTPKAYAAISRCSHEESSRQLQSLEALGVLKRVRDQKGDRDAAFVLEPGSRERLTGELYPRQILTLWSMHEENLRRAEARNTYAMDSRAADEYSDAYTKDERQAEQELEEMVAKGHLTHARLQPVNYWVVLKEHNFLLHFMTSFLITAFAVIGTILLSSMLGYALATFKFPGRFWVLGVMIGASLLPGEARIIPIFKMLLSVGAMENLWGMVLWMTSAGVGNALLMAGYFLSLPKEIREAAAVDGAGPYRTFFDIALPMARPIVSTVGLFAFLGAWNNFLVPLLCTISRPSMQPLAVAVYNFQAGHPGKWHQINAAAAIMIIPVIILFLLLQRHIVKSIAVGALKG